MKENRPSATAVLIAEAQTNISENPATAWMVKEEEIKLYKKFLHQLDKPLIYNLRKLYYAKAECFGIPGLYLHFALRKLTISKLVSDAIQSGVVKQVVAIAAGFDTLSTLMAKTHPHIDFYELDHPATQKYKIPAIRHNPGNLHFVPVDLTSKTIVQALNAMQFDKKAGTIFIAEGITMYLDEIQVKDFFKQIRSTVENDSSQIFFTFLNKNSSGKVQFESATLLADLWLKFIGEPLKWGIDNDHVSSFIKDLGFDIRGILGYEYFKDTYLIPRGLQGLRLAKGENIGIAQVA